MGTTERLQSLEDRMKSFESEFKSANLGERIAKLEGKSENPAPESRFKRNAYWIFPTLALVLGSGVFWRLVQVEIDLGIFKGDLGRIR